MHQSGGELVVDNEKAQALIQVLKKIIDTEKEELIPIDILFCFVI